jgi:hypothetical protein
MKWQEVGEIYVMGSLVTCAPSASIIRMVKSRRRDGKGMQHE